MKKKYIGVVLASVFVLSLFVLSGLNVISVVATSSTSSPPPECTNDTYCEEEYGEWCHNEVRVGVECVSGECASYTITNCDAYDEVCAQNYDDTWCEEGDPLDPECTFDRECPLDDEDAICINGSARNGYCMGSNVCTYWDQDCVGNDKACVETPNGAECITECRNITVIRGTEVEIVEICPPCSGTVTVIRGNTTEIISFCDLQEGEYLYDNSTVYWWNCYNVVARAINYSFAPTSVSCNKASDVTGEFVTISGTSGWPHGLSITVNDYPVDYEQLGTGLTRCQCTNSTSYPF
jgi:hypothetical protein